MQDDRRRCLANIDVVILCGGLGTRLRGVLDATPKVLAPIAGRPFLDYLLAWLSGFGARRFVLALGYRAEAVLAAIARFETGELQFVPVIETAPLGTAGALRLARGHVGSDPALVVNGDSFVAADLCAALAEHRRGQAWASVLCTEVADTGRYGRIELAENGRIASFLEKAPGDAVPGLINAGVYIFSAAALDAVASGDATSLERDVLAAMPAGTLQAIAGRHPFIDIGTPESWRAAADFLPRMIQPLFADESATPP